MTEKTMTRVQSQLLSTLEKSRNYTLGVAGAMTGSGYHSRPVEGVWNFRELMHHIVYGIHWWKDNYVLGNKTEWDPPRVTGNKKDIIAALDEAYASLQSVIEKGTLDENAVAGFHATLDHITHHRGQAVTYLRIQGITPPEYVY